MEIHMVFDTIINTNVFKKICRYAFFANLRVRTGRKSGRKIRKEIGRKYYQFIDSVKYFSHVRRKVFLHYQKL